MTRPFIAGSLEAQYAFLDDLPESFVADVVTLPSGSLADRVAGVLRWRKALLDGRLPPPGQWPSHAVETPVRRAFEQLGIARFCRNEPSLVDALLRDALRSFSDQTKALGQEIATKLLELERLERVRLEDEEAERARREKRQRKVMELDEATLRRLQAQAERDAAQRDHAADESIVAAWGERVRAWTSIADVFGDLGEMMGRGWDTSLGVLRHVGWTEALRLRDLIETLPQLREIVRALGRLHARNNEESVAERLMVPVRRLEEERREIRTPLAPMETRGIERSGEIARMLPAEAVMLGHPKLRLLWHARRAERALLTYQVEGVMTERIVIEREDQEEIEGKRPRPERGPIVVVVDTSGSMHGLPEQVAKALVLETLRTAHSEKRRAFVYAYSGPGQVVELELDLTFEGIGRLLSFLGFTFGGGNDETGVMQKVLARVREKEWKKADVMFISDGEWPVPAALEIAVKAARDLGTRFHGVQIGNVGATGLHRLCDPVHVFADWAAAGGWR